MKKLLTFWSIILFSAVSLAQVSLSLELHAEHEGFVGDEDLNGYNTYRLYLQFESDIELPYIVFGDENFPLEIQSSTQFFQSEFGGTTGSDINPIFFPIIPSVEYDSFLSIGVDSNNDVPYVFAIGGTNPSLWMDDFEDGNDVMINDSIGGGVFIIPIEFLDNWDPIEEGKFLIAQLTTDGNVWGKINFDYYLGFGDAPFYEEIASVYGLEFGSSTEMIFGCVNPDAMNYNPAANVIVPCDYLGDLDGDGIIDMDDLLDLLAEFGCLIDCGEGDLNGNGVINANDILIFLTLI